MSYSVLILSTTVYIPQCCRRSLHRHRHPCRTAAAPATAAATAAAAACCCAAAVVLTQRLRLVSPAFVYKIKKTGCSVVVVMMVMIEPGRAAVPQLMWRGHRHRHLLPRPRCCCCCCGGGGCGSGASSTLLLLLCCFRPAVCLMMVLCRAYPVGESGYYRTMSKLYI